MFNLISYILFAITVALASLGIVLSTKLRSASRSEVFGSLLYQQVFTYTFGFYSIWGQAAVTTFLSDYVSPESLSRIRDVAAIMGFPFLVFAWLMLLKFTFGLSGKESGRWFNPLFLLFNFIVVLGIGYLITLNTGIKPGILIRISFISLNIIYFIASAILLLSIPANRLPLRQEHMRKLSLYIIMFQIFQIIPLLLYESFPWSGLIFVFIFFAGNCILPAYIYLTGSVRRDAEVPLYGLSFETFCRNYEVSPRESEIIKEICNGLSNKEISEKLFISLQTVKDHTHRIYIKTNVKSRVQLIYLVQTNVLSIS